MNVTALMKRSTFRIACLGALLVSPIVFFLLATPYCKADDETHKAVRRSAPQVGAALKDQRRVALVIGNDQYKESPLRNPVHDAEDVADVLRKLGFTVLMKINANQREMEDAVREFVREIQDGDIGLFYFSGHGVQVSGENYLIPVAGSIETETDCRYKAVNAGLILGKMEESRNRTNILILDACRNNPFKGFRSMSKGLTMMDAPVGTFIAYATAPGSVAADGLDRNSPYAKHLIQSIKKKDAGIEQVFKEVLREVRKETGGKQIPWTASSLQDDFYFNPSSPLVKPSDAEKREDDQEVARRREAERVAALERERLERESQDLSTRLTPQRPLSAPSSKYKDKAERLGLGDLDGTMGATPAREELWRMCKDPEAAKWFREAAELGDPVAQLMVGRMVYSGIECSRDKREAAKWFKRSAEQGNALAQNNLGKMCYFGDDVPQDYAEAAKWYGKSAEQGNALAQAELARMHYLGLGVPNNNEVAAKWFRRAAEQGNAYAQAQLGYMYRNGYGVPADMTEAIKWVKKAAEQGYADAQSDLGWMFQSGYGAPKDRTEAIKWYKKAAEQGSEYAKTELKKMGVSIR